MKTVSFSIPQLLKQLKNDLWCKEVVTGYTTSYTWEANQLGHFAIGFAPTILLASLIGLFTTHTPWLALAAIFPIAFMIYKELGDVSAQRVMYNKNPGIVYLNTADIWMDAGTAVMFSTVGAIAAASTFIAYLFPEPTRSAYPLMVFGLMLPPCFYVMRYWISKKICFQNATLPYTMRLSSIPFTSVYTADIDTVTSFLKGHIARLVIAGGESATRLAVAIGTELSFQQYKVRYGTFDHFIANYNNPNESVNVAYTPWTWEEADFIILDDVEGIRVHQLTTEARMMLEAKNVIFITEVSEKDNVAKLLDENLGSASSATLAAH